MKTISTVLAVAAVLAASSVSAQKTGSADPDRMICRKETPTGSRLGARRTCHTAGEWAEMARADRMSLERTQMQRYKGSEGGGQLADPFRRLQ